MKAIICDDYGSLENLTYIESEPPKIIDPDDVIIKVESCGVNFPDGLLVQGKYQHKPETPFIPGMEVSGKICSIGLNVKEFDVGDRVAGLTQLGGYAEITKVNKELFKAIKRILFTSLINNKIKAPIIGTKIISNSK